MSWSCDQEHKPVQVGATIYCAKCGTKLGNTDNRDVVPVKTFATFFGWDIDAATAGLIFRRAISDPS